MGHVLGDIIIEVNCKSQGGFILVVIVNVFLALEAPPLMIRLLLLLVIV